jgi:tryptophan 2,3-dioxygenase
MTTRSTSYADYLRLEEMLVLQSPRSVERAQPAHDEMLFIITHQAHELWFKQILHELDSVIELFSKSTVDEKNVGICVSRLTRITEIQKVLIDQLRVLETMTPLDFLEFRDLLSPASGFQSTQFRKVELKLGLPVSSRFSSDSSPYVSCLAARDALNLKDVAQGPSLFALVEKWLERTPFLDVEGYSFWKSYREAVESRIENDKLHIQKSTHLSTEAKAKQLQEIEKTFQSFEALFDEKVHETLVVQGHRRLSLRATHAALFINLYRDQPILQMPFRLLTLLVDIDELLQSWRAQHAVMVHRMIGVKVGTGGSMGYNYLKSTLDSFKIFTDFFNLSTFLIPRSALPQLPDELRQRLAFAFFLPGQDVQPKGN